MKIPYKYRIVTCPDTNLYVLRKTLANNFRLHWHDCCEAELVLAGSGTQMLNGNEYRLEPGALTVMTPADCHSYRLDGPMELITVMFSPEVISQTVYESILTREMPGRDLFTRLEGAHFTAIRGLFEALCFEASRTSEPETEPEVSFSGHILDGILTDLLRCCPSERPVSGKSPIGKAVLYLHNHFHEKVTLTALAELTHLSPNYFSELFSEETGHTFKSYLIDLRMRNACRLLANTDMTVTDICYACGFESFSNFMRTFKGCCGISPMKFRAQNRSTGRGISEKMQ